MPGRRPLPEHRPCDRAHEVSDVAANLFSTERVGADEVEIRSLENRLDGVAGNRTRRPLNNPCASHQSLLFGPRYRATSHQRKTLRTSDENGHIVLQRSLIPPRAATSRVPRSLHLETDSRGQLAMTLIAGVDTVRKQVRRHQICARKERGQWVVGLGHRVLDCGTNVGERCSECVGRHFRHPAESAG